MTKLSVSCVYANFSHFYLGIFCLRIFYLSKCPDCLVITLWKCEYCLIWALNKLILFGSNALKVSILCYMYSEKSFFYSLIWKELSENVSVAWYKLWKSVYYCLPVTLWKYQYCLTWTLKMCLLLFVSNSLKVSVVFDMNSEKVFSLS